MVKIKREKYTVEISKETGMLEFLSLNQINSDNLIKMFAYNECARNKGDYCYHPVQKKCNSFKVGKVIIASGQLSKSQKDKDIMEYENKFSFTEDGIFLTVKRKYKRNLDFIFDDSICFLTKFHWVNMFRVFSDVGKYGTPHVSKDLLCTKSKYDELKITGEKLSPDSMISAKKRKVSAVVKKTSWADISNENLGISIILLDYSPHVELATLRCVNPRFHNEFHKENEMVPYHEMEFQWDVAGPRKKNLVETGHFFIYPYIKDKDKPPEEIYKKMIEEEFKRKK